VEIQDLLSDKCWGLTPLVLLLLDVVGGEYDVMTRIGGIDFEPLPAKPAEQGLRPLKDLAAVVDSTKT